MDVTIIIMIRTNTSWKKKCLMQILIIRIKINRSKKKQKIYGFDTIPHICGGAWNNIPNNVE